MRGLPRVTAPVIGGPGGLEQIMAKLNEIEGIGEVSVDKLNRAGVQSVEQLLEEYCGKKARTQLAETSGISEKLILKWVNKADLCRVKGISTQYADLLEQAGVDTIPELAQRNAENLTAAMAKTNEEKNLVRKVPTESQVQEWVAQAKELPRMVTHS